MCLTDEHNILEIKRVFVGECGPEPGCLNSGLRTLGYTCCCLARPDPSDKGETNQAHPHVLPGGNRASSEINRQKHRI